MKDCEQAEGEDEFFFLNCKILRKFLPGNLLRTTSAGEHG